MEPLIFFKSVGFMLIPTLLKCQLVVCLPKSSPSNADTYFVVPHESGVSGLEGLAGGGRGGSSLVLGISALVGGGLGGLRHGEGVQERLWEKEQRVGKVMRLEIGAHTPKYPSGLVLWDRG